MHRGAEMSLSDAQEALAATARLAGGRRLPVLVDSRGIKSQSKEARDLFGSKDAAAVCVSVALLVGTPVSRVIGNFFLRRMSQPVPTQLFTEETSAIQWLRTHAQ